MTEEDLQLLPTMTVEQKKTYGTITQCVAENRGGLFFLHGFGRTGRTFLWRGTSASLRSKSEIILTVASSIIAALLILGGRIEHSRFQISLNVNENSTCNIKQGSNLDELIIRAKFFFISIFRAKLIIWDEAPLAHRHCFERQLT